MVLWFASGLFMVHFPIEEVRGEDQVRDAPVATFSPAAVARRVGEVVDPDARGASRIEVRTVLGRPLLLVERPQGRPSLFDATTGELVSPIPASMAVEIAWADYSGSGRPQKAVLVKEESTEYRGALPAWRVSFDDERQTSSYVAADLAKVTARRTNLWRIYDFMWGLHIMDWKHHQDFNSWWLWAVTAAALLAALAGMVMLPNSFRKLWRRKPKPD
jgi:hypothetical protein